MNSDTVKNIRFKQIFTGHESDDTDNVPHLLRRVAFGIYGAGFVLICTSIIFWYQSNLDEKNAYDFIYANIQILVTIFAVTLGATLLGLQFRAQSYTMLALIKAMKNHVVYGFILIFLSLIIFNMFAVIFPFIFFPIDDISILASLAMIGTIFSVICLIGYVYYMIKKVQPLEILSDVQQEMEKISWNDNGLIIKPDDNEDEMMKWYDIWEQIMTRSVELDNRYVFRQGMCIILTILDKPIRNYLKNSSEIDPTSHLEDPDPHITKYLKSILVSCIEIQRNRFVDDFFKLLEKKNIYFRLDMWKFIMMTAIDRNNITLLEHVENLKDIFERLESEVEYKEVYYITKHPNLVEDISISIIAKNYFDIVAPVIKNLIFNNKNISLKLYLKLQNFWTIYPKYPRKQLEYPLMPLSIWEMIMHHSIKIKDHNMFCIGMRSLTLMLLRKLIKLNEKDQKQILDEINSSLINIMNDAIEQNTNNIFQKLFFEHFFPETNVLLPAWRWVMIKSIHNLDINTFKLGLECREKMLGNESNIDKEKIIKSVENFRKTFQSELEYENHNRTTSNKLLIESILLLKNIS